MSPCNTTCIRQPNTPQPQPEQGDTGRNGWLSSSPEILNFYLSLPLDALFSGASCLKPFFAFFRLVFKFLQWLPVSCFCAFPGPTFAVYDEVLPPFCLFTWHGEIG